MSAIGNYIHLTTKGYQESGLSRPHEESGISFETARNAQRALLKTKITHSENFALKYSTTNLQSSLNRMLKLLGEDTSSLNENDQKWAETAKSALTKMMEEDFKNLQNLDFSTGTVTVAPENRGVGQLRTNYTSYKRDPWRQTVEKRVNQLNEYLRQMQEIAKNVKDDEAVERLQQGIDKVEELITDTYQKTWENTIKKGLPVKKETMVNLIKKLNEVIVAYAAMPAVNLQSGSFFGKIISLIPTVGQNIAEEEVIKTVKESLQSKATYSFYNGKNFQETKGGKTYKFDLGDITQYAHQVGNKINVSFEWNHTPITAHVSNVNIGINKVKDISLMSNAPFLFLLQDSDHDFINHFFNLYADTRTSSFVNSYSTKRAEALNLIKLTLVYKALTGDDFSGAKRNIPKMFILSNNTAKENKVKVVLLSDIINQLWDKKVRESMFIVSSSPNDLEAGFMNTKVPNNITGQVRIERLLQDAHNRKINVLMKSSAIGTWKN